MSHDGIRILSPEQAAREAASDPELSPDAVIPLRVCVKKTAGTGVEINWKDGHHSAWTFAWLRNACPCATCHEARQAEGRLPGEARLKPVAALPLYEAPARPLDVTPVGRYALRFNWNDGHNSGIYSWEYLRRMCRCDLCLTRRGVAPASPALPADAHRETS